MGSLLLWSIGLMAQVPFTVPDTASFYTFLDSFDRYYPPDTLEGGDYNKIQRARMTWGPRLAPDGNMSRATAARIAYTRGYHNIHHTSSATPTPQAFPPTHPASLDWDELGPVAPVVGSFASNGYGMGQIHRLAFHPAYNGTTNQILYAGSHYAGLFRSDDSGQNWYNYHTDRGLAMTSVGGVATSNSHVFICTGNGDHAYSEFGRDALYEPLRGSVNNFCPIHTHGVFRASHTGNQWTSINGSRVDLLDGTTKND